MGIETAERDILASIDRGAPVLVQGPVSMRRVLGYRSGDLYGVATFADAGEQVGPSQYNVFHNWRAETKAYIRHRRIYPRAMDEQLLRDTLRTAVCPGDAAQPVGRHRPRGSPSTRWRSCWYGTRALPHWNPASSMMGR